MQLSKRVRILAAIVGSGIVVASSACGNDSTAPTKVAGASQLTTTEARSTFVPTEASKARGSSSGGSYRVTFNPAIDQVITVGPHRLDIPANAVCQIGTSGYGPAFWDQPCTPETSMVTLTIAVDGSNSSNPQVDFKPAMRFNPATNVTLYFYVPEVSRQAARNWQILYCPTTSIGSGSGSSGSCVDEAKTDRDLRTYVDYDASVLFRRLKHFSVYRVDAEDSGYLVGQ